MAVNINAGVGTEIATALRDSAAGDHEQLVVAGRHLARVQVTPVIDTAAYATGDVLGGLQTIANAARFAAGGGLIRSITVLDKTQAQRAAIDILFFDRSVTVAANNAPVAMSDADMANFLGLVAVAAGDYNTAWPGTPLNSVATKVITEGLPFVCQATSLFAVAVVRGTPTYTSASDLVFSYTIEAN
jgi:hypothetical protein